MNGHRERLRQRFLATPHDLNQAEFLELLLTFAVPRRDVAPMARALLARFGSLAGVLQATHEELASVPGIGESSSLLIQLIGVMTNMSSQAKIGIAQEALWPEPEPEPATDEPEQADREMRTFGNDEVENALVFLPEAVGYDTYEAFKLFLQEVLPYNSVSTRVRRANYLLNRFYPDETLETPLTYFASRCSSKEDLKAAVFYELLRAEPIAARVAEEVIWPSLPRGWADRGMLRECVLRHLPDLKPSSQKKTLQSLFNTFALLGVAEQRDDVLRFAIHPGTTEAFLYVLVAEFPEPGMYPCEALDNGPMRHWLLWDREWIRQQLYVLRDIGVVSKVSEIDDIRQFMLPCDRMRSLKLYLERP